MLIIRLLVVFIALLLVPMLGSSQTPETEAVVQKIFKGLELKPSELRSLRAGEIVVAYKRDYDVSRSNIVSVLLAQINGPVDRVADELRKEFAKEASVKATLVADIHEDQPFPPVKFEASEIQEVDQLLKFKGGDRFNLSAAEIKRIQEVAKNLKGAKTDEKLDKVSAVYGEILENRYRLYRESGLKSIAPYQRNRGRVSSPAKNMRILEERIEFAVKPNPKMHAALIDYPNTSPDLVHTFRLIKRDVRKRPVYALMHRMVDEGDVGDDFVLIHQREYFAGHTYNGVYILVFLLSHEGGTLAFLSTDAFTDRVTGAMSGVAKPIGRGLITGAARPLLQRLQKKF